ncbi:tetratricopeptide repeat protein [Nordella sp. HKS 07]|uniref:tetratricopeptide repeat protein n=1 Tax=Nordella sp. HKS 07 TaxID=2712222 RepID=UPI0013E1BBB8|nr:tetratricopeptide repeat protein [Nordella sp. HKS 07]QIG49207.1 tetratricopeptide repeat protein [Nordella sp. HKS 07]
MPPDKYFQQALRDDPNNAVLIERVFIFDLSEGKVASAEDYAERVLSFNSQHRMARFVLGLRDVRLKRFVKARENFKKAAYTPIGELTATLLTAWTYAAQGNQAQAFSTLDKLDRNESLENFKSYHGALIADYLGANIRADSFYKKAYSQAGNSLRVVQAYGNYLERNGRKDEARKVYEQFLATAEKNPLVRQALTNLDKGSTPASFVKTPEAGISEALFSVASALSDDQGLEVALAYAQLALSVNGDRNINLTLLGDIYESMSSYQRSIEAYDAIDKTSVLKPNAELEVAVNLQRLEKKDEAKARLKALVASDPKDYDALVTLGNLYRNNEEFAAAADSYNAAIALLDKPDRDNWTVYYYRGIAFERTKQWDKAETDFRKALQFEPDQPMVLNYLGYSMVDKNINLPEAIAMVRKAVELKPNDGYIVDSLGWAHFRLGEYEEAVKQLERAVELKPADPVIADHLGDAYWRVGRQLEARFQWQHAKDNKPEPEDLARIEKKLKEGLAAEPPVTPAQGATSGNNG